MIVAAIASTTRTRTSLPQKVHGEPTGLGTRAPFGADARFLASAGISR
jgi:hypothetical protein